MNSDKNASAPVDKAYSTKDHEKTSCSDMNGLHDQYDPDLDVPTSRGMPNRGTANGNNTFHERDIEKVEIRRKHQEEAQNQGNQVQGVH
ncbi:unnamed protein product [Rhizoctonia solani]|uniref:Uncharacterized protein n=1 Tax=Rhizoctonia solani TaxID=456999 RepID=A0A8H2X533_9AGAM|nr:unnamed protein product [Rhizoctonia solani]